MQTDCPLTTPCGSLVVNCTLKQNMMRCCQEEPSTGASFGENTVHGETGTLASNCAAFNYAPKSPYRLPFNPFFYGFCRFYSRSGCHLLLIDCSEERWHVQERLFNSAACNFTTGPLRPAQTLQTSWHRLTQARAEGSVGKNCFARPSRLSLRLREHTKRYPAKETFQGQRAKSISGSEMTQKPVILVLSPWMKTFWIL